MFNWNATYQILRGVCIIIIIIALAPFLFFILRLSHAQCFRYRPNRCPVIAVSLAKPDDRETCGHPKSFSYKLFRDRAPQAGRPLDYGRTLKVSRDKFMQHAIRILGT
jgi:hypothetical protein